MFSVSILIRMVNLFLPFIFFELFCCKPGWVGFFFICLFVFGCVLSSFETMDNAILVSSVSKMKAVTQKPPCGTGRRGRAESKGCYDGK